VELRGEDLSSYSNKTQSVWFKKVSPFTYQQSVLKQHQTQTAFNVLPTTWRQKNSWNEGNYVTITLLITILQK